MCFKIREATPCDADAIQQLNLSSLGYAYPLEKTAKKLQQILTTKKDKIFVATVDQKVVGYIHACDYEVLYAPSFKNIMAIAVNGAFRQMGIGKALICCVEEWAKQTGASGVRLVSGQTRKDAHEFYLHCGYEKSKNQINFKKIF